MKFSIIFNILSLIMVKGEVRHEVVFRGGNIIRGYVSEMTHDSLKLIPDVGLQTSLDLDSVLYIQVYQHF